MPQEYEMSEIMFSDELPDNMTFPDSSKIYFNKVIEAKSLNN